MSDKQWMIYGANGYTGELCAREAKARGLTPVLAGRNEDKIAALAAELGFEQRIFGLDDAQALANELRDIALVLHCAGPFSATSAPMVAACIEAGAHYLDITGEIEVFEHAQSRGRDAHNAGVVLCPGVGFDVIPTDCVAAELKAALPDATHLYLGFDSRSGMSPGTAKTTVEGLSKGGKVRQGGHIETVPLGYRTRRIDFGDGEKLGVTIPWGDVSTAWYTTEIPNIEVYIPASPGLVKNMQRMNTIRPLLGLAPVQAFLKWQVGRKVQGPDEAKRDKMPTYVWGEVENTEGDKRAARIKTANGYTVTVHGSVGVAQHLLLSSPEGGAYTPSKLMGKDYVTQLPGSGDLVVE